MKRYSIWLLLLLIPLYGFWISPTQEFVEEKNNKIEKSTKEKIGKIKELQELHLLKKELNKLTDNKKSTSSVEILRKLPSEIEQEKLLKDLQKIAGNASFRFNSVNFSTGMNKEMSLPEIRVDFSVKGPKSQVKKFLRSIETNERFLGMDKLTVNVSKKSTEMVSMKINLYAFAQEELQNK